MITDNGTTDAVIAQYGWPSPVAVVTEPAISTAAAQRIACTRHHSRGAGLGPRTSAAGPAMHTSMTPRATASAAVHAATSTAVAMPRGCTGIAAQVENANTANIGPAGRHANRSDSTAAPAPHTAASGTETQARCGSAPTATPHPTAAVSSAPTPACNRHRRAERTAPP
ncbi:hypothetical protein GCM10022255_058970 [Dactylosporangium darangshiense]|uniref:Uncharacterized protein n=1 Tax=Dactylosporangium darangshiense TaxID=579108 RepID=A0ABP8DFD7_9ACTN